MLGLSWEQIGCVALVSFAVVVLGNVTGLTGRVSAMMTPSA